MMIILTNLQAKSAYKYKVPGVHTLNVSTQNTMRRNLESEAKK